MELLWPSGLKSVLSGLFQKILCEALPQNIQCLLGRPRKPLKRMQICIFQFPMFQINFFNIMFQPFPSYSFGLKEAVLPFLFIFLFIIIIIFCYFLGRSHGIWRFPGQGSNRSCRSNRPTPEPQQRGIRAASATYTTAQSNAGSLTH